MTRPILVTLLFIGAHVSSIYAQPFGNLKAVNSKNDEQNPVIHPDGKHLFFTRAYDSANVGGRHDSGDIYMAEIIGGQLQKAKNAGKPLNDPRYNSIIGLSPDGKTAILSHQYAPDGMAPKTQALSYSNWQNGKWTVPKKLAMDYFMNKSGSVTGSVSKNGKIMVLSLDSFTSRGKEDIYVLFYENGSWSQPKNLGSDINTPLQEVTPYLAPDGKTLFYSSNGFQEGSGRNVYKSERLDSTWRNWSKPEPLGPQVNSIGVELYFRILNQNWAMMTSTKNSDGYGDLRLVPYQSGDAVEDTSSVFVENYETSFMGEEEIENSPGEVLVRIKTLDEADQKPVRSSLFAETTGRDTISFVLKEGLGIYEASVPDTLKKLKVEVKASGYLSATEQVVIDPDQQDKVMLIRLKELKVGAKVQLDNVYFEQSKAVLKDESFPELDRVVEMLKENPNIEIKLEGHTDNQGNSKLNLKLSQERVDRVKEYLVQKGVSAKRIKGKGYGGSRPIASNASEATRKLNRRVEFVVVKD
jgi:OOP family OmpA-OmpF porin